MAKKRVIVCGTTFGQIYLDAIAHDPDTELVGIMAQSSERSVKTAEKYGVPLYHSTEELPEGIDIAFVVVRSGCLGGMGTEIAEQLLEAGVNVMQEHPVHYKDIEKLARTAVKNKKIYLVGDLYKHLRHVNDFTACAKELNEKNQLLYIKAAFSSQVSYPAADILLESLPSGSGFNVKDHISSGGFQVLTGDIKGIPFTFEIHHEVNPADPNNNMDFMHEIEFVYAGGRLLLANTFGPLLWFPKMNTDISYAVNRDYPEHMYENSCMRLDSGEYETFQEMLDVNWRNAVGRDIALMCRTLGNNSEMGKLLRRELAAAKMWNQMTSEIGYANIAERTVFEPFPSAELKKIVSIGE